MKKTIIIFITVFITASIFLGCATTKNKLLFKEKALLSKGEGASLVLSEEEVFVSVGFNALEDKRPKSDISYMTSIREKVSSEVLKTLNDTRLFDEIHFPATDKDNIIISGEARKFGWDSFDMMISYIPGLNVLPFLGLPSTRTHSEVEIYLEMKNIKTGEVILGFSESHIMNKKYNIYNFKPDKANKELAFCFDKVLNKIKERILLNKNHILMTAGSKPPKVPKPEEVVKSEETIGVIEEQKQKQESVQEQNTQ